MQKDGWETYHSSTVERHGHSGSLKVDDAGSNELVWPNQLLLNLEPKGLCPIS